MPFDNNPTPERRNILQFVKADDRQFVIPVYQRNYTWIAKEQVNVLLEDVTNLIKNPSIPNHFTGIFMFAYIHSTYDFSEISIIDGQQRLTTTFLILWALFVIALERKERDQINALKKYLYNLDAPEIFRLKLKPLVADDDVYRKLISVIDYQRLNDEEYINSLPKKIDFGQFTDIEKRSNVYLNFNYIYKYLRQYIDLPEEDENHFSIKDVMTALGKLDIVIVPLQSSDNAQQIFESINGKGKPLSSTDLIRNFILMNLESQQQEDLYLHHWKRIEDIFTSNEKNEFLDFFRYFLSLNIYNLPSSELVYKTFVLWWNKNVLTEQDRVKMLDLIYEYAVCFKELYYDNPDNFSLQTSYKEMFKDFHKIGSYTVAPFIMEVYHMHKYGTLPEHILYKIINLLNIYIIRRELAGMKINDASRFFPQLLKSVKKHSKEDYSDFYETTLRYLVNINKNNTLGIPLNVKILENLKLANAYKLPHIDMVLLRIENSTSNTPLQISNTLSVEHIMPQTYNDYWKNVVGSEELINYAFHSNKFGNLTLVSTSDNSGMQNKDFEHKKNYLRQSRHIKMNEYILEKESWNITEIDHRLEVLCNRFFEVYPYQEASRDMSAIYDIYFDKKNVKCHASIDYYGTIFIQENTMLMYKVNSAFSNNVVFIKAKDNNYLDFDSEGNVILKAGSKFESLKELSDLLIGKDDKYLYSWVDEDGKAFVDSIVNLIDYREN